MCRIFAYRNGAAEKLPSLWDGVACCCPSVKAAPKAVIAFTGAGGKTTWIYQLAKELCRQEKRVLIMTTTHMYEPPAAVMADNEEKMKELLNAKGLAVAGRRDGRGKIAYAGDRLFAAGYSLADVMLIEADGSRRQPLKLFGRHEPALPRKLDCVLHMAGLSALGAAMRRACFRWEAGGGDGTQRVTADVFSAVVSQCLAELQRTVDVPAIPVLNQADDAAGFQQGKDILDSLGATQGLITCFTAAEREDVP